MNAALLPPVLRQHPIYQVCSDYLASLPTIVALPMPTPLLFLATWLEMEQSKGELNQLGQSTLAMCYRLAKQKPTVALMYLLENPEELDAEVNASEKGQENEILNRRLLTLAEELNTAGSPEEAAELLKSNLIQSLRYEYPNFDQANL